MRSVVAAVVQLTSTADVARNLAKVEELCVRARARGAQLVALPENFALLSSNEQDKFQHAVRFDGEPAGILLAMRELARRLGLFLVLGGLPEQAGDAGHVYNACALLGPDGQVIAVYRKIHLFDVDFPGAATTLRESSTVAAGDPGQAVVAPTPWGGLGLSVCYDVRFPELYRRLAAAGATLLTVPAAFTLHTGKDHWHVLLRARAIENQCFLLAPAQQGRHSATRITYGHSLIVDPWGTVLADCPDGEGVAIAELELDTLERVRRELPCLAHRRVGASA
ncbi:MAG: carbon-nitrogen hydrolase family protein [Polyangia bacterium]